MKTFDEAVEIITKQKKEVLTANFDSGVDHTTNEAFALVIEAIATNMITKIMIGGEPLVEACSHLHSAFEFGLLVGMEMEKER